MARTIKLPTQGMLSRCMITFPVLLLACSNLTFISRRLTYDISLLRELRYYDLNFPISMLIYTVPLVVIVYWVKKSDRSNDLKQSMVERQQESMQSASASPSANKNEFDKYQQQLLKLQPTSRRCLVIAFWCMPFLILLYLFDFYHYVGTVPDMYYFTSCIVKLIIGNVAFIGVYGSLPSITINFENVSAKEQAQDFTRREQQKAELDARLAEGPLS